MPEAEPCPRGGIRVALAMPKSEGRPGGNEHSAHTGLLEALSGCCGVRRPQFGEGVKLGLACGSLSGSWWSCWRRGTPPSG
jgi:hypothetical protein